MRRLFIAITALVLATTGTLAISSPAQALTGVHCAEGNRDAWKTVNDGSLGNDEWDLRMNSIYRYCKNYDNGLRWVKPLQAQGYYNAEGSSLECNKWQGTNVLEYVQFDFTYFDQQGNTFNPGPFNIPCDESSANGETVTYADAPRLFWTKMPDGSVKAPSFRADISIQKENDFYEVNTRMTVFFRALPLD